jgi:hypothetical protein
VHPLPIALVHPGRQLEQLVKHRDRRGPRGALEDDAAGRRPDPDALQARRHIGLAQDVAEVDRDDGHVRLASPASASCFGRLVFP